MARILQVCNTGFFLGKFLAPLIRALRAAGHSVVCVCEGAPAPEGPAEPELKVIPFEFPRSGSPLSFAEAIRRLRTILRRGRYDLVDSHNRNASIVARIAAWRERVPVSLYTAHGFYFHDDQSRWSRAATQGLERVLARITDHTLSQSREDADLAVARGWVSADRIQAIGNGIDTARFRPGADRRGEEAALGLASGRFRIASTGRLVPGKGLMDLLEALGRVRERRPEAELLIVGGALEGDRSSFGPRFAAAAAEMGLARHVVVTGITARVERYLACADAFVLPSYREGMPRSLLEAMSMELPVVATEIRGCREIVESGRTGYLYPPHDVERLSEILQDLIERREEAAEIGRRARARVVERFDERRYVAVQVECIERLLRGGGPRRDVSFRAGPGTLGLRGDPEAKAAQAGGVARGGGAALVLTILILFVAPAVAASIGRSTLEEAVSRRLNARLEIDSISVSLLGGRAELSGIRLIPDQGPPLVTLGRPFSPASAEGGPTQPRYLGP